MSNHYRGTFYIWLAVLFGITLLGAFYLAVAGGSYEDASPAVIAVAYAPSLATLAAIGLTGGFRAVSSLLRQLLAWRTGLQWYALALLGPFILILLAKAIGTLTSGSTVTSSPWWVVPDILPLLGPLFAGMLGEEIGWRGFAQPLLQKRYSILWASVIIGVIWSMWHLWPVLTPEGWADYSIADIIQTFVRLIATSIIYGWLYNVTSGSLPVVMIAHASHNLALEVMPVATSAGVMSLTVAALYAVAAGAVVWAMRARPVKAVS